jgi:hypothetical protein
MVLPVKERSIDQTGAGFIKVFASFELKKLDTDPRFSFRSASAWPFFFTTPSLCSLRSCELAFYRYLVGGSGRKIGEAAEVGREGEWVDGDTYTTNSCKYWT